MNEIELIRDQLARERARVVSVSSACAGALGAAERRATGEDAPLEAFVRACREYLEAGLAVFVERDRRLVDLCARLPGESPERRALERLLDAPGGGAEAKELLAKSGASRAGWPELAHYVNGAWRTRREAIEDSLAANQRVSDWRAIAALDADSILAERARFARLQSLLPAGIELAPRAGRPGSFPR